MLATQITNHVDAALGRLLQQYQNQPNIVGLITALAQHVQKLENALFPLDQYRQLAYSYGQQLDNLGLVIGQGRNGLDDTQYLLLLYGTIAKNFSDSTRPALLNIIKQIFQASGVFFKDPNSTPGTGKSANISYGVGSPALPSNLFTLATQLVQNSDGAGIGISYISNFNGSGCFACAGKQAWTRLAAPTFTPTEENPWPFGCGAYSFAPNPYMGGNLCSRITV